MAEFQQHYDVIIIGAGPAGSLAASLLTQHQISVLVLEKQHFPRFSIGESLLPQSMVYLEQANLLEAVERAAPKLGFQHKDGAAFFTNHQYTEFRFAEKFSAGPNYTYQVKRAEFDRLLAEEAQKQGAEFRFGVEVTQVLCEDKPQLQVKDEKGVTSSINTDFILDASGFARVLPRLLDLNLPSDFPVRSSVFCHLEDRIDVPDYDRNKILVETHPQRKDVWYWLIPFADGTCSAGCVAEPDFFAELAADCSAEQTFDRAIDDSIRLRQLLSNASKVRPVQQVTGYSANVKQLYGQHFALLGNAGEFLDPIFSSGVTIAFKSAKLASDCLIKQFNQEPVCWQEDFAQPLQEGVDTFKAFVHSWYQGQFQDIVYYEQAPATVREMVCSVLAGYAWDKDNPFVDQSVRRLNVLGEICAS